MSSDEEFFDANAEDLPTPVTPHLSTDDFVYKTKSLPVSKSFDTGFSIKSDEEEKFYTLKHDIDLIEAFKMRDEVSDVDSSLIQDDNSSDSKKGSLSSRSCQSYNLKSSLDSVSFHHILEKKNSLGSVCVCSSSKDNSLERSSRDVHYCTRIKMPPSELQLTGTLSEPRLSISHGETSSTSSRKASLINSMKSSASEDEEANTPLALTNENEECASTDYRQHFKNRINGNVFLPHPVTIERYQRIPEDSDDESSISDMNSIYNDASRAEKHRKAKTFGFVSSVFKTVVSRKQRKPKNGEAVCPNDYDGDVEEEDDDARDVKLKVSSYNKQGPTSFARTRIIQEIQLNDKEPIWVMKFSPCGVLIAAGGKSKEVIVWILKNKFEKFEEIRKNSNPFAHEDFQKFEPRNYKEDTSQFAEDQDEVTPFRQEPYVVFKGHTADVLDLCWTKRLFVLSSSMDKTVRLWHIQQSQCLCLFSHNDFVTSIVFDPGGDRHFLSGSMDGKVRLWSITDKKTLYYNAISSPHSIITAVCFVSGNTKVAVGTYSGQCLLYNASDLKYLTRFTVASSRRSPHRNKVTSIVPTHDENQILITTNDSRVRIFDFHEQTVYCKFKGHTNQCSQIKASLSRLGNFIICGSEDHAVYFWSISNDITGLSKKENAIKVNKNWESVKAHNCPVTVAIFAPNPQEIFQCIDDTEKEKYGEDSQSMYTKLNDLHLGEVFASADHSGAIKFFVV